MQVMEMKDLRTVAGVTRLDCVRSEKERVQVRSSGGTGEKEEGRAEIQNLGESLRPNGKNNERASGREETRRETQENME